MALQLITNDLNLRKVVLINEIEIFILNRFLNYSSKELNNDINIF